DERPGGPPRARATAGDAGGVRLATGGSLRICGLLGGGVLWPWISWPSLAVLGGGVALLVGCGLVERRAEEPILPGWLFTRRILNGANLVSPAVGAMLIGLASYVPPYPHGLLPATGPVAGFPRAAMPL